MLATNDENYAIPIIVVGIGLLTTSFAIYHDTAGRYAIVLLKYLSHSLSTTLTQFHIVLGRTGITVGIAGNGNFAIGILFKPLRYVICINHFAL